MGDKKPKKNSSGNSDAHKAKQSKAQDNKFMGTPKPEEKGKKK